MKKMKRLIALLLALAIALSLVACGAPAAQKKTEASGNNTSVNADELSREDKELIADLVGGVDASDMSDEELDVLIQQLLEESDEEAVSNIVNLSTGKTTELPEIDVSENADAYDENGAITKPFDQVYPEVIEKEQVSFSGESILVKLKSGTLTDGLKAAGIGALEEIVPMDGCAWYEAMLVEGTSAKDALEAVRELDGVLLAEYNYEIKTAALDEYKHFDQEKEEEFKKNGHNKDQWHHHYFGIPDGYEEMETEGGDSSVVVAVIDTGVDYDHQDLIDSMWTNSGEIPNNGVDDDKNGYIDDYYGVDLIAGKGSADDDNGHGTHVAGIIAAQNNNVGIVGIAYNVKIMPIKAAMHNGTLNQADIAEAVLYAYEMGAEVINMSFGGSASSIAVQDALSIAYTRCVLVASAGNSGASNEMFPNYPAALTYVMGVMSVNQYGNVSIFSNWDEIPYNSREYEVYAPGENIMSTLPGDRYGYLSGTSMAAPVVSAFAAILRSEFGDRDMYPTKFIYGQLASTSDYYPGAANSGSQQIVNLQAALTKLPKPEVNMQDYEIFDSPNLSTKNNGDGVIDAGETIALGLTLRNRWGMSKNTLVTIDTLINDISDPYIEILNPTVDYGSIGTYSTGDCGKIYTDELFTGWKNPFLIKIADDCPNDYQFTLNVNITYKNALDEEDTVVYESEEAYVWGTVRNGVILPAVIEEDMVLTKDNLYIIPNSTVIQPGTTVRVQPGTHIQFWSDDPQDPYSDNYIAYLLVNGNFVVEGTKEEPVYIYPSQLMDRYAVEINTGTDGVVSMKYADITNFFQSTTSNGRGTKISYADHCTFRFNYDITLYYRYLSNGKVYNGYLERIDIGRIKAKNSVFYKLSHYNYAGNAPDLNGSFYSCIFVECDLDYLGTYKDCVFLKCENDYIPSNTSTSVPAASDLTLVYREETGTTYVRTPLSAPYISSLLEKLGGHDYIAETEDEWSWVKTKLMTASSSIYVVGTTFDYEQLRYVWDDGSAIGAFADPDDFASNAPGGKMFCWKGTGAPVVEASVSTYNNYYIYEIPGEIYPTEITFSQYEIILDLKGTYQLSPMSRPARLDTKEYIYESSDESILTVDETGLVTPAGKGTADVYVYSKDRAVWNYVTFRVTESKPLEDLHFQQETMLLPLGETVSSGCVLTPADTTQNNVVYTSDNENAVRVDASGNLTAVASGTAVITATCAGFSDTLTVTAYRKATSLAFKKDYLDLYLEGGKVIATPDLVMSQGAEPELVWSSNNVGVAEVIDGQLVLKKQGSATVTVTDTRSGLSDTIRLWVNATAPVMDKVATVAQLSEGSIPLPGVTLAEGIAADPVWMVDDPAVAEIVGDRLLLKGEGYATVFVKDPRNDLTDSCVVYVMDGAQLPKVVKVDSDENWNDYFLTDDGNLYMNTYNAEPIRTGVKDFAVAYDGYYDCYLLVLMESGVIEMWYNGDLYDIYYRTPYATWTELEGQDVAQIAFSIQEYSDDPQYSGETMKYSCYARMADGSVYAWGTGNDFAQLGTGDRYEYSAPTLLGNLYNVTDMAVGGTIAYFLYGDYGSICYFGGKEEKNDSLVSFGYAAELFEVTEIESVYYADGYRNELREWRGPTSDDWKFADVSSYDSYYLSADGYGVAIRNGEVYSQIQWSSWTSQVPGITDAVSVTISGTGGCYAITEEGFLIRVGSGSTEFVPVVKPFNKKIQLTGTNLTDDNVLLGDTLILTLNTHVTGSSCRLKAGDTMLGCDNSFGIPNEYHIRLSQGTFEPGVEYTLSARFGDDLGSDWSDTYTIVFTYGGASAGEETVMEVAAAFKTLNAANEPVIHLSQTDPSVVRFYYTPENLVAALTEIKNAFQEHQNFVGNAILNPVATTTDPESWFRLQANAVTAGTYTEVPLGGNYWGTTNERAIGLQMIDYADFITYARFMYEPYLTTAPENTFPFVASVKLINSKGEEVTTVGNEQITFRVTFNRDMDTSIPLQVRFGSAAPYGDYEIPGQYVDARTWEGVYTLKTVIENGNQRFTISNGCSATGDLELQLDRGRFGFVVDTTAAQALVMQGTATDTGVELRWTQDDFDTLMGYNVYRSTKEDGLYTRLNKTVIPADAMSFFDDTVEPGVVYYYNFTVVKTDLTESEPSGKIAIMSKDTMAPNIYHSPVTGAFTGSNLVLSATVTDNLSIAYANLYYRVAGAENWNTIRMNSLNDKYSAIIPAAYITAAGVEYYIEAFDGVSFTYKGSAENPYTIAVQESINADALGDVDGDGVITNLDALLLLYTINDKYNMTAEEFARADLNGDGELWAAEALRILQYVSGVVGSVKM